MKQLIRQSIQSAVKDLREIRRSKSSSVLIGMGHTIAIKDSFCSIRPLENGSAYNFTAMWNRDSVFWTESVAIKKLAKLRLDHPEMSLEVAHQNDLRDRHEKHSLFVLNSFFQIRNKS